MDNTVLLHTCCGPCATYVTNALMKEGFEVVLFFYNPNIHPFDEYVKRYESFVEYARYKGLKVETPFAYNPLEFFEWIKEPEERCVRCYEMRLGRTARWAREQGYPFFTTTLTISPYQDLENIFKVGEKVEKRERVVFLKKNFRSGFTESVKISRELGLYRQNYCGCIFSKWEGVKRRIWKSLTGPSSS